MKRIFAFLRSMKFGVMLLLFVMACSLAGSLIPQGRGADWYIEKYPDSGTLILALKLDNIFSGLYFVFTIGLLCVNLTLCSLIRFTRVRKMKKNALLEAESAHCGNNIGTEAADNLRRYLSSRRFHRHETEKAAVFYKNMTGYYGSFVVHLSILLTLVFGGLVLSLSEVTDYQVMPGEKLILQDGTELSVDSFRTADETGRTDYVSEIRVTSPDGAESGPHEIKVNYPFSFHSYKYYQHSYGTAGSITALNTQTGGTDVFYLNERSFLSNDGRSGIWFEALYPGFVEDDDGHIIPLSFQGGAYPNPVYRLLVSNGGDMESVMAFPGDTLQAGDISFTVNEPISYPGIRIKRVATPFPTLLYASFLIMVLGFWLCFFHTPVLVMVSSDGYTLSGSKTTGIQLEIESFLNGKDRRTDTLC